MDFCFWKKPIHPQVMKRMKRNELVRPIFFSHGKTNSCGVAIGYIGNQKVNILNKKPGKYGRILILDILDVMVDETNFVLVNIYNPNTKTEQVTNLLDLGKMLETIKHLSDKHIVLAGDFNFFFDFFLSIPRFVQSQTNSEKEIYSQIYQT